MSDKVELRAIRCKRRYSSIALCGVKSCSRLCTSLRKIVWEIGNSRTGKSFAVQFCSDECCDEVKSRMAAGCGLRLLTAVGDVALEIEGAKVGSGAT